MSTAAMCPVDRATLPLAESAPTLLVFSDDWGRHPSSCQHLVTRLLNRHRVLWVNTIGMRPPRLDLQTLRRGVGKISQWISPRRPTAEQSTAPAPRVLNPRMWPWMQTPWQQATNASLLERQLTPVLNEQRTPVYAVTTVPVVADLIGRLPVERWTYYCVDDFTQWPGLDGDAIRSLEDRLFERCDAVIAASAVLQRRAEERGCPTSLLTHGVDLEHWSMGDRVDSATTGAERSPQVLFFGLIDERLDSDWLNQLDANVSTGSISLVGPCQTPPRTKGCQRVTLTPAVPYADLPAVAARADVLVMPYIDAEVTRAMQPLKLLEYLATGKPVVVRDLPANRAWADCLDLASTAEEFVRLVRLRIGTGLPLSQRTARQRLLNESWDAKAEVFRRDLLGLPTGV